MDLKQFNLLKTIKFLTCFLIALCLPISAKNYRGLSSRISQGRNIFYKSALSLGISGRAGDISTDGWYCRMDRDGDHHVHPDDCARYYKCHKCVDRTPGHGAIIRCVKIFDCPAGQIFNGTEFEPGCISGHCPVKEIKVPPGWKCDGGEQLHVHPSNCKRFYKCFKCEDPNDGESCYDQIRSCSDSKFFDDSEKKCVKADKCPQDLPKLPPEWHCDKDGEINVHPKDCSQYYKCKRCNETWCYEATQCPNGKFFDDIQKKCVISKVCPQQWVELPSGPGWHCEMEDDTNVHPDNCTDYYVCIKCDKPSKWCYIQMKCPEGETFDDELTQCVRARCPQWPTILPQNWTCNSNNELNGSPVDCMKYYSCVTCPDSDEHPWCYVPMTCVDGQLFDERQKLCVDHVQCPSLDKELPEGDGWMCEQEGEMHVFPDNCADFYICYPCSWPKGWCYEHSRCLLGSNFDEALKTCVHGTCPQNQTEIPKEPGWHCDKNEETNVLPGNCSKFYMCETCSKPSGWCYTEHNCPEGHTFDDDMEICVMGTCPQDPKPIPPNFNCTNDGDIHVNPTDCSRWYECVLAGSYFTWKGYQCEIGENFDENTKLCVSGICPQLLTEIGDPPEWQCTEELDLNVFPGNCSKYYTCLACSKPKKWCYYLPESCPPGHNFDQSQEVCVEGDCPQDRPEIKEDWTCADENEEHVLPEDCKKFYTCHPCDKPKKWCYDEHTCPSNETYDNLLKLCVPGRCPQLPQKIPDKWNCTDEGERHVFPEDCTSFFTCIKCEDGPWCYNGIEICPDDQTFDDTKKECVHGRCPQDPPLLPPEWTCEAEYEQYVHPSNCSMYYTCFMCPDQDSSCYNLESCEEGETFDDINKKCVNERCPQTPPTLPEGWNCTKDGELNVDPKDCKRYYICVKDCPDAEWCHVPSICPEGSNFDDGKKECVEGACPQTLPELPKEPGWMCINEGEIHVHPVDCSAFYICHRCSKSDGWCYEKMNCPVGSTFHETKAQCIPGRCPQWPEKIPPDFKCAEEGELWIHPEDCMEYYKCIKCPDGGWCFELYQCPESTHFNDKKKKCVEGPCSTNKPTVPPPPPPPPCSRGLIGRRYPDLAYCECFWTCQFGSTTMYELSHDCCYYLKRFNKETERCEWGYCYNEGSILNWNNWK